MAQVGVPGVLVGDVGEEAVDRDQRELRVAAQLCRSDSR